jgi:hypothetical protein
VKETSTNKLEDIQRLRKAVEKLEQDENPMITIHVADEVFIVTPFEAFWLLMMVCNALGLAGSTLNRSTEVKVRRHKQKTSSEGC